MIRNLIFDIGNVLAKFGWVDYLKRFHFEPEKEAVIAKALFAGPYWNELDRNVIPMEELREKFVSLAPQYREDILTVLESSDQCITQYPYTIPWLKELKSQGFRLYFLSNYPEFFEARNTEALNFRPLMDGGLFSYEVKLTKPDPAIFHALMQRHPEIIPEESVFFDDSAANAAAASALHFHGIQFFNQEQAIDELKKLL